MKRLGVGYLLIKRFNKKYEQFYRGGGGYPIIGIKYWQERIPFLERKLSDGTFFDGLKHVKKMPVWMLKRDNRDKKKVYTTGPNKYRKRKKIRDYSDHHVKM